MKTVDATLVLAPARDVCHRESAVECPNCHQQIALTRGLCGCRQIDAVLLQSSRVGSELDCTHCGQRFILHRADPLHTLRASHEQNTFRIL